MSVVMASRFQAPTTPSLPQLNAEALAGDDDALRLLVQRSGSCETAWEFVERYVPQEDALRVFDRYVDCFNRARAKALLDTLELPAVAPTNLTNWKETP